MQQRRQYRKSAEALVVAVRLDLDTQGFSYNKWGAVQRCKAGDWLVNNDGECYSIDADTFASTYQEVSQGLYRKVQTVWAEVATEDGSVQTREGTTHYRAGDYLVSNAADGSDDYAVSRAVFEQSYEPVES